MGLTVLCVVPQSTPVWLTAVLLIPVGAGGALAVAVYGALITTDFLHGMRVGLTISTVLLLVMAAAARTLKRPAEVTAPMKETGP